MNPRDQYERTICGCSKCRRPCRTMPGMLIPGDLERIAEYLNHPIKAVLGEVLASPGALVGTRTPFGIRMGRVPTIVPATCKGRCVFLEEDDQCAVHLVAPYGCSHFDFHMSKVEGDERSEAALRAILTSRSYLEVWKELWLLGRRSPGPEVKRSKIDALLRVEDN